MRKGEMRVLIALHLLIMVYSCSGILSKVASGLPFMSWQFVLCYGSMIAILGFYAIGWQQIIKRMPLTSAYASRAVTVIWGIVWGALLFHERVTLPKVGGALLVLAGVALFALDGSTDGKEEGDAS